MSLKMVRPRHAVRCSFCVVFSVAGWLAPRSHPLLLPFAFLSGGFFGESGTVSRARGLGAA